MTDESGVTEVMWRLVKHIADGCTTIEYGEGTAMIGAGRNDSRVCVMFYDRNGHDEPQQVGSHASSTDEPDEEADKITPRARMIFNNRESLQVLKNMVEKCEEFFDAIEAKAEWTEVE